MAYNPENPVFGYPPPFERRRRPPARGMFFRRLI